MKILKLSVKIFAVLLVLLVSACDQANKPACSKEFVSITVRLEDTNAKPVSAKLSSRLMKINQEFAVKETATKGNYVVLDDSFKDKLSITGDRLELIAIKDKSISREIIVVAVDKNRCHVKKISGPEKLVLPAL